jgi:cytochrome c
MRRPTRMRSVNFTKVRGIERAFFYAAFAITAGLVHAEAAKPGPEAFNNHCRTCHSVKEGDNRLGPSLHKIIGRKPGTTPGYQNYSQSLKNSGITWDEATLDKFIANPDAVVPNNNMKPFKGVTDPEVRKKIIDYLKASS